MFRVCPSPSSALALALALLVVGAGPSEAAPRESPSVAEIDPLALSPEMIAFAETKIGKRQSRTSRLLSLREAIFDSDSGLGITYGSSATYTAAETLERRTGNCLSFTLLYVALARYLKLDAYFVEVDEVTGWSQRGQLGFSHWHMYAEVEVHNGLALVDFLPWSDRRYRSQRRIGDSRARAHYFSNVGAERLAGGDRDGAMEFFRHALELDPGFHPARVNMAVALRRGGDSRAAETTLLQVLEVEPGNAVAAANLASLYLESGREEDARRWLEQRLEFLARNPFHHFRLGLGALRDETPEAARAHFRRAIDLLPHESIFHEQLARAYRRLGEARRARNSLKRAIYLTDDPQRRERLRDRLRAESESPGLPGAA